MSFSRSDYIATYNLCVMIWRRQRQSPENKQRACELAQRVEAVVGQLGLIPADHWHSEPTASVMAIVEDTSSRQSSSLSAPKPKRKTRSNG